MSKIPINEVYFVSKHVKSSNQRGVVRRWSRTEVSQSSMSRISINEVYFVSKQACAKRAREREREREREKEGQAWQEFQSTRCTSSPSMSRIPINEVYFVSISLQACQEFQSTRYTLSRRCTSSLVGDWGGSAKHVKNSSQGERERERERGREGGASIPINQV